MQENSGLFQDEIRMRKLIYDQLSPVVAIAKENMVTNSLKNQEIMYAREEIREFNDKIKIFEKELTRIPEFGQRI
jgi:hypothetical protein